MLPDVCKLLRRAKRALDRGDVDTARDYVDAAQEVIDEWSADDELPAMLQKQAAPALAEDEE